MNTFTVRRGFRCPMTSNPMHRLLLLIVSVMAFTMSALAQDIQKLDTTLEQLVGSDSKLERIATGFNKWTEGPVWTHKGTLLFAEIPANNIDLWVPDKGASVFMHPSGYAGTEPFKGPEPGSNGMILDADGRVSVAGHARRNVWRMESLDPKSQITILADSYQGKKLNSPNDLVYKIRWFAVLHGSSLRLYLLRRTTTRKRSCRSTVSIAFLEHAGRSPGQNRPRPIATRN